MGIAWWVFWVYFILTPVCYYMFFAMGVKDNWRLKSDDYDLNASAWDNFIAYHGQIIGLLALDFLKIHCPWSKTTSVKYRVVEAHRVLEYDSHEKGWTAGDCHDPAKHGQIAKDCFQSRTRFWAANVFHLLTAPIRMVLLLTLLFIAMPIAEAAQQRRARTKR